MNTNKTSYHKLFRFVIIVAASVLVFVGCVVVPYGMASYRNSKLEELKREGDLFIDCIDREYSISGNLAVQSVCELHRLFSKEYKLNIYVYARDGECLVSPSSYTVDSDTGKVEIDWNAEKDEPLSEKMIKKLENGKVLDYERSSFAKNEPQLFYGRRIFLGNKENGTNTRMYIVIYGKTRAINRFSTRITLAYVISAVLFFFIARFIIRKRLKVFYDREADLLRITEKYAKGDFSEKLTVESDDAMKDIADYINALALNVENSEETSKTFIANVSHELRTPITTVGGFVDGILDGTIPKTRQNEYLVLVSKEIHRLKILISSMLNMSRFESGTLSPNFKPVNITELVIQTVLMFEKKIESKELEIEGLDCGKMLVTADQDLMQQVIYNLVENATKFVNTGGTISFRFEKTAEWFEVGIKNTGEGLKNDEIKQVFDRFYKTDSSRGKDTTGLGLGLSISRKIIHLHKGHIVVKSVYGEYTEFTIQLPLDRA